MSYHVINTQKERRASKAKCPGHMEVRERDKRELSARWRKGG
jgi:hypothetical protein